MKTVVVRYVNESECRSFKCIDANVKIQKGFRPVALLQCNMEDGELVSIPLSMLKYHMVLEQEDIDKMSKEEKEKFKIT